MAVLLLPHLPTLCEEILNCNLQILYPGYHLFFRMWWDTSVSGAGRQAEAWKVSEFTSQRIFCVANVNATLNEEHCVTKHKTAAKTVNRDFATIEVEVFITLFA